LTRKRKGRTDKESRLKVTEACNKKDAGYYDRPFVVEMGIECMFKALKRGQKDRRAA